MQIEELKSIIVDQRGEAEGMLKEKTIIERDVDRPQLLGFIKHPNVLIISGVRRSGKSTLALQLLKGQKHGHINFDDERLAGFKSDDFNRLLQAFFELYGEDTDCFIFDEIQNIENWELFINRLRRTKKIIITGSNANLLSGELSTHLTGRHIDFVLYPFSFKEFLKFNGLVLPEKSPSTQTVSRIKKSLSEYIALGGFPEVYKFGKRIVEKIYEDIINKDILLHYKVRHKTAFKELAKYLISNFTKEMGYSKLKNVFAIKNIHTIKDYVGYLSATYLVYVLEKFSYKLKQQVLAGKKAYGNDTGLINFLAFRFSEGKGRLMENIVLLELLRRKSYFYQDLEVYFWRNYSGEEVDFVVKEGKKVKQLIQVAFSIENLDTKEREIKGIIAAAEELNCDDLLLINWEEEKEIKIKNRKIKIVPLWKWLLA